VLYLLDANTLITAHNTYYPIERVPEFWTWVVHYADAGKIKMPIETFEEVKGGTGNSDKDKLYDWIQSSEVKNKLLLDEEANLTHVQMVVSKGYAPNLSDIEIDNIGQDPFLISYCLASPSNRCVVTGETSQPSRKRSNRKVPDVCKDVGVLSCNIFAITKKLGFSTAWDVFV
jgi:hypothetical protein